VDASHSAAFRELWPRALSWVEPYYDAEHMRETVTWLKRIDPEASEALRIAALTHDMERYFPGGPRLDKRTGAWDDRDYNARHTQRSAAIVADWLRMQELVDEPFVAEAAAAIAEHEFGGSPSGDKLQGADSLSFLDVNGALVARWVLDGETSLEHGLKKLDWMYERIVLDEARALARPLYERSCQLVRDTVTDAPLQPSHPRSEDGHD
jgi:HD domain